MTHPRSCAVCAVASESGIQPLSKSENDIFSRLAQNNNKNYKKQAKSYSIDFGEIFIVNKFLESMGLLDVIKSISITNSDTLLSLLLYRLLYTNPNKLAHNWWNKTYCKYLYPQASLKY
jgi:hypothetical protein